MNLPYFNFYSRDWLADTAHLTYEQKGVFGDLLCHMWGRQDCELADDDKFLASLLHLSVGKWRGIRAALVGGFSPVLVIEQGQLISRRLKKEREKASKKSQGRSKAANERWYPSEGETTHETPQTEHANALQMQSKSNAGKMHPEADAESELINTQGREELNPKQSTKPTSAPGVPDNVSAAFESFWENYPRDRDGMRAGTKSKARKEFQKVSVRDWDELVEGLARYHQQDKVLRGYVLNAETWLKEQKWKDALEAQPRQVQEYTNGNHPKSVNQRGAAGTRVIEDLRRQAAGFAEAPDNHLSLGPGTGAA